MTKGERKEAIGVLENAKNFAYDETYIKAFDLGIEALKQEPCEDCLNEWWQSEYKEPIAEKIANAKPSTWLTDGLTKEEVKETIDNALVEANNAKWQKAIEAIKEEIEPHAYVKDVHGEYDENDDLAWALEIIDKHTKELI